MKKLSQQLLELREELDLVGTKFNGVTWQRIERHMKEFALESCKETLKNASENARIFVKDKKNNTDIILKSYETHSGLYSKVHNPSILSENNIPKEVRE